MINFEKLKAEFPGDRISWRIGSTMDDKSKGLALAYIDARDVMERLDEVCGPQNWQCKYSHANGKTVCDIGLCVFDASDNRPNGEWVWKADGAGDSDVEAEKGALSDAFKRAAVRWGIGRYLYDDRFKKIWVEIEPAGKSFRIKQSELNKLAGLFGEKTPKTSLQSVAQPREDKLKDAHDEFVRRLNLCTNQKQISALREANTAMLIALKKDKPSLYEKLSRLIEQTEEAFELQGAAE